MNRLGLIIGNSKYEHASDLENPLNDVKTMKELLIEVGFEIESYLNLDYKRMRTVIDNYGEKLSEYDTGLFFYAGHGIQVNGRNYLVPIDANPKKENQVEYHCTKVDQILGWMYRNEDNTNILMLDACRNNPFKRSWDRKTVVQGLAPMDAPKGTIIAYSTSPGKTASDGSGNNSPYTKAIENNLLTPNQRLEDFFKSVRKNVLDLTSGNQLPWETTSLVGDFFFIKEQKLSSSKHLSDREIYEYLEGIWDSYEEKYSIDKAEALVFINASEELDLPIIDIIRSYSRVQNEISGLELTDKEIDVNSIRRLKDIGFENKYHRWFYNDKQVRMGELHLIPDKMLKKKTEKGKEISINIDINCIFKNEKLYIKGVTNIPEGMKLMITLSNKEKAYFAQCKVEVEDGNFISEGFTKQGDKLSSGKYEVKISSPIASIQPQNVKKQIGKRGLNLVGEYVDFDLVFGKRIKFNEKLEF